MIVSFFFVLYSSLLTFIIQFCPTMSSSSSIIGQAYFPLVNTDTNFVTAGLIVMYKEPPRTAEWTWLTERPNEEDKGGWLVNPRLLNAPNKALAIQSSLNALPRPLTYTYVDVVTPQDSDFTGASCGMAVFIAGFFGITSTIITGFLMEGANTRPSELRLMDIDNIVVKCQAAPFGTHVDAKHPLYIPFGNVEELLASGFPRSELFTTQDFIARGELISKQVKQRVSVIACGTIGDLIILRALFLQ